MRTFNSIYLYVCVNSDYNLKKQFRIGKDSPHSVSFDKCDRRVKDRKNYCLMNSEGGWMLINEGSGVYEAHFCYQDGSVFRKMRHSKKVFEFLRDRGCVKITGQIAIINQSACQWVKSLGFRELDTISG